MKKNVPTFAVDANLLIILAAASEGDLEFLKKKLSNNTKHIKEFMWFDTLVKNGEMNLVILPLSLYQLKFLSKVTTPRKTENSKKQAEESIACAKRAIKYVEKNSAIKKVFIKEFAYAQFKAMTQYVGEFYCTPYITTEYQDDCPAPFVTNRYLPTKEACLVAESTMLGLDFLTLNSYIAGNFYNDTGADIQAINKKYLKSSVRPYHFYSMTQTLDISNFEKPVLNPDFVQVAHRTLIEGCVHYSHNEYMQALADSKERCEKTLVIREAEKL